MNRTIEGKIRRIVYNPFSANTLNPTPTVVFYMEGDATLYTVGSIRKGLAEAVLLSKPGDEIIAQLEKSEHRFAVGAVVTAWTNKTFDAEQASLASAQAQLSSPAEYVSDMYSNTFHGIVYYFTSDEDVERARTADAQCGLDKGWFEDELDSKGIKWSNERILKA
jgi:hypothetical protein